MALFANYAVVFARMIIDKKDHGIVSFIVQIRDLNTHKHMPGI